jgi:hypothetical protein
MMPNKFYAFSETDGNTARETPAPKGASHQDPFEQSYLKLVVEDATRLRHEKPITLMGMGASGLSHLAVIGLFVLGYLLIEMFNWQFSLFKLPDLELNRQTEIEYVIVQNRKPEPPKDPNTKNRAEVASKSGGAKTNTTVQSEAQQAAGGKPSVAQQAQQQGGAQSAPAQQEVTVIAPNPSSSRSTTKSSSKNQAQPKAATSSSASTPTPDTSTQKAQSPSTTGRKTTTPTPKTIGVSKPKANKASGGSPAPKTESDDNNIAWDAPGPILSSPNSGGSGGTGAASSGGGAKRVSTGSGNSSSNQPASAANVKGSGGSGALNSSASGGGGGGLAGVDALPEPDMSPYINNVNNRIRRNWVRPESSPAGSVASFKIRISRSGGLMSSALTRSSGDSLFDTKAKAAISAGAPFGAVPANFRGSSVDIDFTFTVNGASGR